MGRLAYRNRDANIMCRCRKLKCISLEFEHIKFFPAHMLLYLMTDPTITATAPSKVVIDDMILMTKMAMSALGEKALHSQQLGRQVEFSR